jgi:hypothetical protein
MQPPPVPFYLNWAFWTAFASAMAVILSQLPPIKLWFKKAKLEIESYSKISITNKLGNPNLTLQLIINNIGGRKTRIKEINVSLIRDEKELPTLPAQTYLQNQNDKNQLLFTTFPLEPNQEWVNIIYFYQLFDREEEKNFEKLKKDMLADYMEQRKLIKDEDEGEDKEKLEEKFAAIENPKELTDRALSFFNSKFIWESGEYLMEISVLTSDSKANISKKYRFTIYETQTEKQKELTKKYKFGADIWWDSTTVNINTMLPIKEA